MSSAVVYSTTRGVGWGIHLWLLLMLCFTMSVITQLCGCEAKHQQYHIIGVSARPSVSGHERQNQPRIVWNTINRNNTCNWRELFLYHDHNTCTYARYIHSTPPHIQAFCNRIVISKMFFVNPSQWSCNIFLNISLSAMVGFLFNDRIMDLNKS